MHHPRRAAFLTKRCTVTVSATARTAGFLKLSASMISIISWRRMKTKPAFLKAGAIFSTILTVPSTSSCLSSISISMSLNTSGWSASRPAAMILTWSVRNIRKCFRISLPKATTVCRRSNTSAFPLRRQIIRRQSPAWSVSKRISLRTSKSWVSGQKAWTATAG